MSASVGFYVKRHGEWRDGVLSVTPHYSATVAGGNIRWQVSIAKVANLTASDVTTTGLTRLAPITSGVITSVDLSDALVSPTSGVDKQYIGVMVSIGRDQDHADDTNTGDVHLYGADLVYKESRRVVGDSR